MSRKYLNPVLLSHMCTYLSLFCWDMIFGKSWGFLQWWGFRVDLLLMLFMSAACRKPSSITKSSISFDFNFFCCYFSPVTSVGVLTFVLFMNRLWNLTGSRWQVWVGTTIEASQRFRAKFSVRSYAGVLSRTYVHTFELHTMHILRMSLI